MGTILHVVQALLANSAPALKRLEAGHDTVGLFSFWEMRGLVTPDTLLRGGGARTSWTPRRR